MSDDRRSQSRRTTDLLLLEKCDLLQSEIDALKEHLAAIEAHNHAALSLPPSGMVALERLVWIAVTSAVSALAAYLGVEKGQ